MNWADFHPFAFSIRLLQKMITVAWLFIATAPLYVAGSKLEATDGKDFTIPLETELTRVEQVNIIFKGENKGKTLLARYCSQVYVNPFCVPVKTDGVSLQVEGGTVYLSLQDVNISSNSGLYRARVFFEEKWSEVNATLVIKASFSSTEVPAHISPQKPPSSSQHQGLYVIIPLGIRFIWVGVFFWKYSKAVKYVRQQMMLKTPEKPLLPPDPLPPKEESVAVNV